MNKQLPLYKTDEEEVMVLQERVAEALRLVKIVMDYLNPPPLLCAKIFNTKLIFNHFNLCTGYENQGRI